jgi:hypothetical protein
LLTRQRHSWIDPASLPPLIVRIAFQIVSLYGGDYASLLNDFPPENLKRMNDYQSLMGEIQDVEVIMQTLADFPSHASSFDALPVRRYYERRHAEATYAFIENMNEIDHFWRPAPDQPFPWEK